MKELEPERFKKVIVRFSMLTTVLKNMKALIEVCTNISGHCFHFGLRFRRSAGAGTYWRPDGWSIVTLP